MKISEILDELRKKDGKKRCRVIATVTYEGDVNWIGATLQKSLRTPFFAGKRTINTEYSEAEDIE